MTLYDVTGAFLGTFAKILGAQISWILLNTFTDGLKRVSGDVPGTSKTFLFAMGIMVTNKLLLGTIWLLFLEHSVLQRPAEHLL